METEPRYANSSGQRSGRYLRTISRVGRRLPAHAGALGKALPAERDDEELPESGSWR